MKPSGPEQRPEEPQAPSAARELLIHGLHLATLTAFAVAQPLFGLLKQDATFFVARQSEALDLFVLAFGLVLLVPLPLLALEWLAGLASQSLRRGLHFLLVAGLTALLFLPPLKRLSDGTGVVFTGASVAGLLGALACARLAPVRSFLTVLSPAPLVFSALFLVHPSISKLIAPPRAAEISQAGTNRAATSSVVLVVLDELPITSLIKSQWEIDAALFPNFARLASDSTWFCNATTNHTQTELAVPTILTGKSPVDRDLIPIYSDHPENIFTLLSGSHRMNVWETFTGLWAEGQTLRPVPDFRTRMVSLVDDLAVVYGHVVLPTHMAAQLPSIATDWGGFRRATEPEGGHEPTAEPSDAAGPEAEHEDARLKDPHQPFASAVAYDDLTAVFRAFVDSIDGSDEPTFHFLHILLPHSPWNRLPTGQRYPAKADKPGFVKVKWSSHEGLAALAYQRHLLQLGHVDLLLGELIQRLEEEEIYDSSLIALVADHGVNFQVNEFMRGGDEASAQDILHIPFFLKEPFQEQERTDDRNVEAIDIVPTIAGALGIDLPWEVDGRSAFDTTSAERPLKTLYRSRYFTGPIEVPGTLPTDWTALEEKESLFGTASRWEDVYAIGPRPDLLGRSMSELEVATPMPLLLRLVEGWRYSSVDPTSETLPTFVEGKILGSDFGWRGFGTEGPQAAPAQIAIAINGTVQATATTYDRKEKMASFAVMVPPEALQRGPNSVLVFGLLESGELAPILEPSYTLEDDRIVMPDGREYELVADAVKSHIDRAKEQDGLLTLVGWAADMDKKRAAQQLLVFHEGERCVFSGPMNRDRPKLQQKFDDPTRSAGFDHRLSLELFEGRVAGDVRLFVLCDGVASEIDYGAKGAWLTGE